MGFFKPADDRDGSDDEPAAEDSGHGEADDGGGSTASASEGAADDGLRDLGIDVGGDEGDALL